MNRFIFQFITVYVFWFQYNFGGKEVDALEFGLMSERDSLSKVFSIRNPNPIRVSCSHSQRTLRENIKSFVQLNPQFYY